LRFTTEDLKRVTHHVGQAGRSSLQVLRKTMLNKIGKKGKEWIKAKKKLIDGIRFNHKYQVIGEQVYGTCPDCFHYHKLTPDHLIKRSQGGGHEPENIEWVCNEAPCFCHSKRDNMGDPKKKKPATSKKADWQKVHTCKECKVECSSLICSNCGKLSV